ncbi:MAG TPA: hypothetical protein VJH71_00340 [Candidatus Paceibacterota bacterium]
MPRGIRKRNNLTPEEARLAALRQQVFSRAVISLSSEFEALKKAKNKLENDISEVAKRLKSLSELITRISEGNKEVLIIAREDHPSLLQNLLDGCEEVSAEFERTSEHLEALNDFRPEKPIVRTATREGVLA